MTLLPFTRPSLGEQTLTLPLFPAMQERDVSRVCEAVSSVMMLQERG